MAKDDKYKRAVVIAARDIKKLRKTVQIQSAVIAALSTAVLPPTKLSVLPPLTSLRMVALPLSTVMS